MHHKKHKSNSSLLSSSPKNRPQFSNTYQKIDSLITVFEKGEQTKVFLQIEEIINQVDAELYFTEFLIKHVGIFSRFGNGEAQKKEKRLQKIKTTLEKQKSFLEGIFLQIKPLQPINTEKKSPQTP